MNASNCQDGGSIGQSSIDQSIRPLTGPRLLSCVVIQYPYRVNVQAYFCPGCFLTFGLRAHEMRRRGKNLTLSSTQVPRLRPQPLGLRVRFWPTRGGTRSHDRIRSLRARRIHAKRFSGPRAKHIPKIRNVFVRVPKFVFGVCPSTLRREIGLIDSAIVNWVRERVLTESYVAEVIARACLLAI
jgi:hypothetical protein